MEDLVLPSVFRVAEAARQAVRAAHEQAAAFAAERSGRDEPAEVVVGAREAAIAFRSERYLRVAGRSAVDWGPLSGDYHSADGWIRLHCNFRHHAEIACRVLGLPLTADRDAVTSAVARRRKYELEDAIAAAGGAAAAMRTREEWGAHPQAAVLAAQPLVRFEALDVGARVSDHAGAGPIARRAAGSAAATPARPAAPAAADSAATPAVHALAGLRVLDLTRVIAGPVAGRVLVGYGADVTMVRATHLPTIHGLDLDFGVGKALRYLDLRTAEGRDAFVGLVREADVLLQSYRPGALAKLGLGPDELAAVRPGLVYVSVSAYGTEGPWGSRRGFDSLVQMAAGIADEGRRARGSATPTPLPGQFLDHAAGWFAAAGAVEGLRRGGGLAVSVSLAGMAHWLDGLGRVDPAIGLAVPDPALADVADLLVASEGPAGAVSQVRLPGSIGGVRPTWPGPSPFG
jgi:crotonobetainyl-CoA:carnitine CoA-transferase CaiB-like acyl-CoA transferase